MVIGYCGVVDKVYDSQAAILVSILNQVVPNIVKFFIYAVHVLVHTGCRILLPNVPCFHLMHFIRN